MPTEKPKPNPSKPRIISLVILFLNALQQSPTFSEDDWKAAEDLKNRLHSEIK